MRWRLILLGVIAVVCTIGFVLSMKVSAELSYRGSQVYVDLQDQAPTAAQQDLASRLYQQAYGLQLLLTPLATTSLICAAAIPTALARRWQLRNQAAATRTMSEAGST